jgi:hypothetical protein
MSTHTFQQVAHPVQETVRNPGKNDYTRCAMLIREHPTYVPAWLWMSSLVTTHEQKRDCLERALLLDPTCADARERLEILRLQELLSSLGPRTSTPGSRLRNLGSYLIEHGYITEAQQDEALAEQKRLYAEQGQRVLFGDMLVRLDYLVPQVLAEALLLQQRDKLQILDGEPPHHIGEYLVVEGVITPEQLAEVLVEQTRLRQSGHNILLGELLLRRGYVSAPVLNALLEQQRQIFFSRFGD